MAMSMNGKQSYAMLSLSLLQKITQSALEKLLSIFTAMKQK